MLPEAMAIAGIVVWVTGTAVLTVCWLHLKAQELLLVKTRNSHYMRELSIVVRTGKAYHKATCEHAVHPVGEVRKFQA